MELKSDLSKSKVGDWVLTTQAGWAQIILINDYDEVEVRYPKRTELFNRDGKLYDEDPYPTCFPADQVPPQLLELYGPPPVEFKDGEPVWVSDDEKIWYPRVFEREFGGQFVAYEAGNLYKPWKYCRKWEDKP